MARLTKNRLLFQDDTLRPLGRFTQAGVLHNSRGLHDREMRVLGSYALVYLTEGGGRYRDRRGMREQVQAGDALLLFPEIPHRYGPTAGQKWHEIYVCFDGPCFDLWRSEGLLDEGNPVQHCGAVGNFYPRLLELLSQARPSTSGSHFHQLSQFMALAGEMLQCREENQHLPWLTTAQGLLGQNLEAKCDQVRLAQAVGMSYDSFRKAYTRQTGISPQRFRDLQRIAAAKTLILRSQLPNAAIARSLGFRDESHFSHRFKELVGVSPRAWKQSL